MKITTFIAMSNDGYIATKEGDISFLNKLSVEGDGGYGNYYSSIDCLIYGSSTYEVVKGFNLPEWPYKGKQSIVLTHNPNKYSKANDITFSNDSIESIVKELSNSKEHLWVMGGANVINQFLDMNLLDEIHLSIANIDLKDGIKLFKDDSWKDNYKLIDKQNYGDITTYIYIKK